MACPAARCLLVDIVVWQEPLEELPRSTLFVPSFFESVVFRPLILRLLLAVAVQQDLFEELSHSSPFVAAAPKFLPMELHEPLDLLTALFVQREPVWWPMEGHRSLTTASAVGG